MTDKPLPFHVFEKERKLLLFFYFSHLLPNKDEFKLNQIEQRLV